MTSRSDRQKCPYGLECYRQNPQHFLDYSHPEGHKRSAEVIDLEDKSDGSLAALLEKNGSGELPRKKLKIETVNNDELVDASVMIPKESVEIYPSNPLRLFLTSSKGIGTAFNDPSTCRAMRDILSVDMGDLQSSVQFNYMFDIPWIVEQCPPEFRDKPMMIVHGYSAQSSSGQALREEALLFPSITLAMARLPVAYGTHHTKMMILRYSEGVRVVVHTSNLIPGDWKNKTQGMWISPVFKKTEGSKDSQTGFRADLAEYLRSYSMPKLDEISNQLLQYDMSDANVFIVASTPGRHFGPKKAAFGHLKLRTLLTKHALAVNEEWPVVGQFSSIGSLGSTAEAWLTGEFLESLSSPAAVLARRPHLNLVFPSVDNVRFSLEGWNGGGSLPYSFATAEKQRYLDKFFHVWRSETKGRSHVMPHIKTYTRVSPDLSKAGWFLVTSANLSKAAWGALEKQSSQLMIRSYELGVLFIPKFIDLSCTTFSVVPDFSTLKNANLSEASIFLPYDLPLEQYGPNDKPWTCDSSMDGLTDRFGNTRR